ncbi:hypothetical protein FOA52_007077 [Chlamydomonas sp. UWO 241]|nr:hypothetical protein FOA52_007077 [Chlamydomonas sp. UWO 241]
MLGRLGCRAAPSAGLICRCAAALGVGLRAQLATTAVGAPTLQRAGYPRQLKLVRAAEVEGAPSTPASSRAELPKNFDFSAEQRIYQWWQDNGHFKPDENAPGEPFVISMPPPNVTGRLHMGHAMTATLEDIMVRHARMRGRKTLWLPGTDHAGIATQSVVEKMLAKEWKPNRLEMGREAFTAKVWEWKAEYGSFITNQLRCLGASCDWDRERFTLDEGLSASVAEAFMKLHADGLIYRGSYMVNWSPAMLTAVSDLEVEYTEEAGFLYFFKYPVAGGGPDDFLPVSTTRPETILGDTAVAVHPEDERYKHLIGKQLVVPCSGGRTMRKLALRPSPPRAMGTRSKTLKDLNNLNLMALGAGMAAIAADAAAAAGGAGAGEESMEGVMVVAGTPSPRACLLTPGRGTRGATNAEVPSSAMSSPVRAPADHDEMHMGIPPPDPSAAMHRGMRELLREEFAEQRDLIREEFSRGMAALAARVTETEARVAGVIAAVATLDARITSKFAQADVAFGPLLRLVPELSVAKDGVADLDERMGRMEKHEVLALAQFHVDQGKSREMAAKVAALTEQVQALEAAARGGEAAGRQVPVAARAPVTVAQPVPAAQQQLPGPPQPPGPPPLPAAVSGGGLTFAVVVRERVSDARHALARGTERALTTLLGPHHVTVVQARVMFANDHKSKVVFTVANEGHAAFIRARMLLPRCTVPVIADDYVDREFGTGALKITPGHDPNDYEIGKRHSLLIINIMNTDATLNANAGKYAGMDRFKVRKTLWADMESEGLVIKKEDYTMRVPRSQRSGEVIEPLVSEQWFVRMEPLAKPALAAVQDGRIKLLPERFERVYDNWLTNIKDWCISRQLWWGHRIPVYYVHDSQADADSAERGVSSRYVVARSGDEALMMAKEQYGAGVVLRQEEDVLDTWFSSGLWPFSTLGWPNTEAPDFKTYYPTTVMETGHDILFFWVARMVMMGMHLTGEVPFKTVYLHGLVRDDKGRKMSKSLGNVVDPLEIIKDYGTDALRFTVATGSAVGQDLNLSMDRVMANRNFTNKLWNAGKYVLLMLSKTDEAEWAAASTADFSTPEALASLPLAERWAVSLLHQTIDGVTERYDKYDFNQAGISTYNFFWDEFADWAIEASKPRTYGDDAAAAARSRQVLVYVLDRVLRLLHPFMPFVTEELWQAIPHTGDALIAARWPTTGLPVDAAALSHFECLKGCVRAVRNARAEYGVEEKRRIAATLIVADPALRASLSGELASIALLAKLDASAVTVLAEAPTEGGSGASSVSLVVQDGVFVVLPMAGLFDVEKEVARLSKQRAKIEKELTGVENKLKNPKFIEKAAQEYVDEAKAQAQEARDKMAMIDAKIEQVKTMG